MLSAKSQFDPEQITAYGHCKTSLDRTHMCFISFDTLTGEKTKMLY